MVATLVAICSLGVQAQEASKNTDAKAQLVEKIREHKIKNQPPMPPTPKQREMQRTTVGAGGTMNITDPTQKFPIGLDLGIAHGGNFMANFTNSGWSDYEDDDLRAYYANYYGVNLGNNQTAWFEIKFNPNRDMPDTNVNHINNPLYWTNTYNFTCRIGVVGSATEIVSVYYQYGSDPSFYYFDSTTGPGWPTSSNFEIQSWKYLEAILTPDPDGTVKPVRFRFVYQTGPNVSSHNGGSNRGGVDYMTWECVPTSTNWPMRLRMEPEFKYPIESLGTYGETTGVRTSCPDVDVDYTVGYIGANLYEFEFTTKLNSPWTPWRAPVNAQTTPIYNDPLANRAVVYMPRHANSNLFVRLRKH